jgi:hypothetical protein
MPISFEKMPLSLMKMPMHALSSSGWSTAKVSQ